MSYSAGNLLTEILANRGITQVSLAASMGRPPQLVSEIVTGKKQITVATARDLERTLGVPAEVWLTTQTVHGLHEAQANDGGRP